MQYIILWEDRQQVWNESSQQSRKCVCVHMCAVVLDSLCQCSAACLHPPTSAASRPTETPEGQKETRRDRQRHKNKKKKQGNRLFAEFKIGRQH